MPRSKSLIPAPRRVAFAAMPVLGPAGFVAVLALLAQAFAPYSLGSPTEAMLINLIVVLGLFVFVGNSGVVSFGHIGFMAVGAYTCALLTIAPMQKKVLFPSFPSSMRFILDLGLSPLVGVLIAAVVAAVLAAIIGYPLMRLSGLAAGMGTFSVLVIVNVVISNWTSVTGGESTMVGPPLWATIPRLLGAAVVAIVVAFLYRRSNSAVRLRASREDVNAAAALGVNVARERWLSFIVSAFLVGAAGGLYALYLPFSPSDFYVDATIFALAMLLVGGSGSVWGAVLGTVFVSIVFQLFTEGESGINMGAIHFALPGGTTEIVVGLAMLLTLIVRPRGLSDGREFDVRAFAATGGRLKSRIRRAGAGSQAGEADPGNPEPVRRDKSASFRG